MSDGGQLDQPILPGLERALVRAAGRRTRRRLGRRRWGLAAAAASLVLATAATAATTIFEIGRGTSADGEFSIETKLLPGPAGAGGSSICLQLSFGDRGPAHGCGEAPSPAEPFGLVIVDALEPGGERVVYGLVESRIASVRVQGGGGSLREARTSARPELPGRFFSVVAPDDGRIELIGYDADGTEIARLGSIEPVDRRPLSRRDARRAGDPAGFAPAISPPEEYTYRGEPIDPATARRLKLACVQEPTVMRCYDSEAEAGSARR